ncbi:tRNA pseudouridine(55) synthase TruB [Aestuariivirga litoralis]|uniref:tRNA pseudouridine synthase B n=1 Tax=Aestuariivirga litoralis TaxID=2650924 RepID=A0A2W2AJY9_9HYPH|nr:tRNA pseudouridine(55) synthase TruB [Aestuariivirga litoralis]PZF75805.1 tRNA pseudouridine(55) synthase TruB [Aestuariivirga litoralis]
MAKTKRTPVHGWVILDKPYGMTSTQAVGKIRWLFNAEKAGHGGTLDPLASGLLPIALGEATKTVSHAMDGRKVYRFTVAFGEERTTDDLEGEVTGTSDRRPSQSEIESILPRFTGEIMQAPPAFSAIKVDGERAYDLARAGEAVELAERPVLIEALTLVDIPDPDHATFEVTCGKGTYIRSLARDMGRALGTAAHVSMLRRVAVGPFTEAHMISLENLAELGHKAPGGDANKGVLLPIETVLDGIPALAIDEEQARRLKLGQSVLLRGANAPIAEDSVLVMSGGKPVGLGTIEQGSLKPKRLFNL